MLAEIDGLLDDWLAGGDSELVAVQVIPPPDDALRSELAVARFAAIVRGLMLGNANRLPLLLARHWVARRLADPRMARACGLERPIQHRMIGHCLDSLTRWGVLVRVDTVKIKGQPKPAHLYELGVPAAVGSPEVAGHRQQQPRSGLVDERLMRGAEVERPIGPLAAARNVADVESGGSHAVP
jgi:hypothetical protein